LAWVADCIQTREQSSIPLVGYSTQNKGSFTSTALRAACLPCEV